VLEAEIIRGKGKQEWRREENENGKKKVKKTGK